MIAEGRCWRRMWVQACLEGWLGGDGAGSDRAGACGDQAQAHPSPSASSSSSSKEESVRVQARTSLTLLRVSVMLLGTVGVAGRVCAQSEVQRKIVALAATRSGSELFAAVNDESDNSASHLYAMSPASGEVIWQTGKLPEIGSAKVAPDGATVAVGLVGVPDRDAGVVLFETKSGKQSGSLGFDKKLIFAPGMVYPRFGSGVSQLNYSPNAALLYGLSNDTLFAWDVASNAYLWIRDVRR
jgi:hypothetical protein